MAAFVLICAGLLGATPPDAAEYQAAAARAGKDARAHVKLAVWCEAHGMDAERLKHLAAALEINPQDAAARGLMGLVAYGGRWLTPEKVGQTVGADDALTAKLAEYEAKRQATPETAEAQWELALWCEKNGLKAEAMAHFSAVTQVDPKRADAWRKLGCEFLNGRWINAEQAAAERAEDLARWKADMHWEPILIRWKRDLKYGGPRRQQAIAALNEITDPRAVPSIHRVFAHGTQAEQEMGALMLSRIPCAASSHGLVGLSLFESWPEGRALAIRELRRRDPREFMDELIGSLHRPFGLHSTPAGPQGEPGGLVIDGEHKRLERVYQPIRMADRNRRRPAAGRAEVVAAAQGATWQSMQRDVAIVEGFNARIRADNRIVAATLTEITGERLGDEPDAWLTWWNDKLGLRYERIESTPKQTTLQYVPVRFQVHHSCFAAGTPVSTLTGPRPIESLRVGDVVLSQDTETGVLSYQPIVGIHHNPPAETVRIRLKEDTVVSTPVHRFWRAGRGWAMARDLSPGDSIRTGGGRAEVVAIQPDAVQPVYNLDVARTHSFFVGSGMFLVRDNSLPPAMFTPFDAEPSLSAIGEEPLPLGPADQQGAQSPPFGVAERGSIWDAPGPSSIQDAPEPRPGPSEPGSSRGSYGGSSARRPASMLGPQPSGPTGRSPH